jgi:hypothetical protein
VRAKGVFKVVGPAGVRYERGWGSGVRAHAEEKLDSLLDTSSGVVR